MTNRREFLRVLMAATVVGFGFRRPIDPQPFLDYTRKVMSSQWSTKVHQDGAILTEATLEKAYQACLRQPSYPDGVIISARTARILNRRGYWR